MYRRLVFLPFIMISMLLFISSCGFTNQVDRASKQVKVEQLIKFGKDEPTLFNFYVDSDPVFVVENIAEQQGTTWFGSCWEADANPEIRFQIRVNSSFPLVARTTWSIVTSQGELYSGYEILDSAQPNSLNQVKIRSIPKIACNEFIPVAIVVTMEDEKYYYQNFYKIRSQRVLWSDLFEVPDGSDPNLYNFVLWQYQVDEDNVYRLDGNRYFDS